MSIIIPPSARLSADQVEMWSRAILTEEAVEVRRATQKNRRRLARFWLSWLRLRPEGGDMASDIAAHFAEQYAVLFDAPWCPLPVREMEARRKRSLIRIESRDEIPADLMPAGEIRGEPAWVREILRPAGYLIRGRSWGWLYSRPEHADARARHPLRLANPTARPGHVLVTKTWLRKHRYSQTMIDALTPVTEQWSQRNRFWYLMYEVPAPVSAAASAATKR